MMNEKDFAEDWRKMLLPHERAGAQFVFQPSGSNAQAPPPHTTPPQPLNPRPDVRGLYGSILSKEPVYKPWWYYSSRCTHFHFYTRTRIRQLGVSPPLQIPFYEGLRSFIIINSLWNCYIYAVYKGLHVLLAFICYYLLSDVKLVISQFVEQL